MKKKELGDKELVEKLIKSVLRYTELTIKEYGEYIEPERLLWLESLKEGDDLVRFNTNKTVTFYCENDHIKIPQYGKKLLKFLRLMPGFGKNKSHKCYKEGELLNESTYFDYLKHVIKAGLSYEEFCEESMPHEVVHLCGSGGGDAFREGLTELRARRLAMKYNLPLSRCGYNKEVEICLAIEGILGEETMNRYAFCPNDYKANIILLENHSMDTCNMLMAIRRKMNEIYYSRKVHNNGILSPFKKIFTYDSIDYSEVWPMIEELRKYVEEERYKMELRCKNIEDYMKVHQVQKEKLERSEVQPGDKKDGQNNPNGNVEL